MTDNVIELTPKEQGPPTDKSWAETAKRNGLDDETVAWLQIRAEEALKIDPETAEVDWTYGWGDPYELFPLPGKDEEHCVGREYWACRPGSDIWVSFDDLPDVTREAIWNRHERKLAFPAGLEAILANSPPRMRMWKDEQTGKVTARVDGSVEVTTFETEAEARVWAEQHHKERSCIFTGFTSFE